MSLSNSQLINSTERRVQFSSILPCVEKQTLQKGLLIAIVVCAALSLHPTFRLVGSLATRSTALLTTSSLCADRWSQETNLGRLAFGVKILTIATGGVGMAAGSLLLILASLIGDLSYQGFKTAKALYQGAYGKALMHTSVIGINSLVLTALATGSAPLMITAAALSAVAMLAIALKVGRNANTRGQGVDTICYVALAIIGAASALSVAEIHRYTATEAHFRVKNEGEALLTLYGRKSRVVGEVNPEEAKELIVPVENCGRYGIFGGPNSWTQLGDSAIRTTRDLPTVALRANFYTYETTLLKAGMPVSNFPTLPIAGAIIFTDEMAI